jgi:hypothetical protein
VIAKNNIIEAAELYAQLCWHVLPVLGKVPQGEAWQEHATATNVKALFERHNFDGVGVLLGWKSGIIDVECDNEEAEETLLELLGGELPNTPKFRSARGCHYLFRWREGLPKKAVFKIGQLEFRTGNGAASQSVFPPSPGRVWEIEPATPVAEFPAWEEAIRRHEEAKSPSKPTRMPTGNYFPHSPSDEALDVVKWLQSRGVEILGGDQTADGAKRWFITCPELGRHTGKNAARDCCITQEASGKLGGHCFHQSCGMDSWDALKRRIGEPTRADYQAEREEVPVDLSGFMVEPVAQEESCELPPQSFRLPQECLEVPGLIGQLIEYNLETALYPRPELALAGALSLMSLITGRKVEDRWELRTNLYTVGLCSSGGGKSHAKKVNNKILGLLGKSDMVIAKPKSGSGLVSSIRETPAGLLQVDELADWLEIMKSPQKSPHTYEILGILKEVYSETSNEFWKPAGYADAKKNPTINCPHLVMYGVAPAGVFWQSLTKQNLTDGLVGRLLVVESIGENESNDYCETKPPGESLMDGVRAWLNFSPDGGGMFGPMFSAKPVRLQHTEEAWRRYREHGKRTEKRREEESEEAYAIWCRTPEKTGKLALLRACSRVTPGGGALPAIEIEDVEWAIKVSNWVTRTMLRHAGLYVAENQVESNLLRLLRLLDDWRSREWLGQNAKWLRAKERDEIIRSAISDEMIEAREVASDKRPRVEFRRKR